MGAKIFKRSHHLMLWAWLCATSLNVVCAQEKDPPVSKTTPAEWNAALGWSGGYLVESGLKLALLPDGKFLWVYGVSTGFGGVMSGEMVGTWTRKGNTSTVCLEEATVGPKLIARPGKPQGTASMLFVDDSEMKDSVLALNSTADFDGARFIELVRQGKKEAWPSIGTEDRVEVNPNIRYVYLAGPGVRRGSALRYRVYRFELPLYPVEAYRVYYRLGPNRFWRSIFDSDGCLDLATTGWSLKVMAPADRLETSKAVKAQHRLMQYVVDTSWKRGVYNITRTELPSILIQASPNPNAGK